MLLQSMVRRSAAWVRSGEDLNRVLANIGWLSWDRLFRSALGLAVGVCITRHLGPEQFGIYSYALAFVALFGILSTLGLDGIVVREILHEPTAKDEILGTVFVLKLTGGAATVVISLTLIHALRPGDPLMTWLVAILSAGALFQALDVIDLWFQSQVRSRMTVVARNTALVLTSLVRIALIVADAPLIAFAWAVLAEWAGAGAAMAWLFHRDGHSMRAWRPRAARAAALMGRSWPLFLSSCFSMIDLRIDQVMLGQMAGAEALGTYSAAVRISEIGYFVPGILASSLLPTLIQSKTLGEPAYHERLQRYYDVNALLALALCVPLSFAAPWVVAAVYGESFRQAGTMLAVHVWAALFAFLGVARGSYLINEGLVKYSLYCNAVGSAVNVGLNLVLIPRYQGLGAAWATVASFAVSGYLTSFFFPPIARAAVMQTRALLAPLRVVAMLRNRP
jgi:PST family polysaccharide transporter